MKYFKYHYSIVIGLCVLSLTFFLCGNSLYKTVPDFYGYSKLPGFITIAVFIIICGINLITTMFFESSWEKEYNETWPYLVWHTVYGFAIVTGAAISDFFIRILESILLG